MEQKFKRQSIELGGDLPSVMVSKVVLCVGVFGLRKKEEKWHKEERVKSPTPSDWKTKTKKKKIEQ